MIRGARGALRETHGDLRALTGTLAVGADAATVQLNEVLRDHEAEAEPTDVGALALHEGVEHRREQLRRDAAALVFHADDDGVAVDGAAHFDAGLRRAVLRGVVHEVDDDLAEASMIGEERSARHVDGQLLLTRDHVR